MKLLLFFFGLFLPAMVQAQYTTIYRDTPYVATRYAVFCDNNDIVWAGSQSLGLIKNIAGIKTFYNTSNSGIASNLVRSISQDSSNTIWVGGNAGISKFDGINWTVFNTTNSLLPSNTINCQLHLNNEIWIGTNQGLAKYDGTNWTIYTTVNSSLLNDTIISMETDGATIYFGTASGLSTFSNGSWINWPSGQNGLATGRVYQLKFAAGRLWLLNSTVQYFDQSAFKTLQQLLDGNDNSSCLCKNCLLFLAIVNDNAGNIYVYLSGDKIGLIKIDSLLNRTFTALKNATYSFPSTAVVSINNAQELFFVSSSQPSTNRLQLDSSNFGSMAYLPGLGNDFLDVNKVSARLLNRGDLHWDPLAQIPQYYSTNSNSKTPVYCSAMWLGGIDQLGMLHTAANTYRQQGANDYYTGPLDTVFGSSDSATMHYYDRFWKIDKEMLDDFNTNYQNGNVQNGTYQIPEAIATWPAHGTGAFSRNLAPFIDVDNDGVYSPLDGDYPELTGHQMLWWIFNDTVAPFSHTYSQGPAFQFEIQGKAYAFNCNANTTADEVMDYTTFYQYKIINRSQNTYNNVFAGLWTDFDLGNASDDYVGCDSSLNTYFAYNGDNNDSCIVCYGLNPPMMNVTFLKGPIVQTADSLDNNHNGIVDEPFETAGMSSFLFHGKLNAVGIPSTPEGHYNYLQNIWLDGQPVTYDEQGRNPANPPTKYMFSGIPYVNASGNWTMTSAGLQPDDMRGLGASGPFTIAPGQSQTIDFAYIFTRDSLNPNGVTTSIAKNTADVQKIINGFNSGNYPCLTSTSLPNITANAIQLKVYPNPAHDKIYFDKELNGALYEILSVTGQLIQKGVYVGDGISIGNFKEQMYFLKVLKEEKTFFAKFVKL